jgi:hypothetical protein
VTLAFLIEDAGDDHMSVGVTAQLSFTKKGKRRGIPKNTAPPPAPCHAMPCLALTMATSVARRRVRQLPEGSFIRPGRVAGA